MSFLKSVKKWLNRDARRKPPAQRSFRPRVEALEDRQLLTVNAAFDWSMPKRFGLDNYGTQPDGRINAQPDGRIDLQNDPTFVQQTKFKVNFDAGKSTADYGDRIGSYQWRVMSENMPGPMTWTSPGPITTTPSGLEEGTYFVTLTVTSADGKKKDVEYQHIVVNDILIVSIGDSAAAGQGDPDFGHVADGSAEVRWGDHPDAAKARRSANSAPARAALQLEEEDEHTSVTFVSVAASGDRILEGVVNRAVKWEWEWDADGQRQPDQGQLEQVKRIVGSRRIDALTVTAGVNDLYWPHRLPIILAANSVPAPNLAATVFNLAAAVGPRDDVPRAWGELDAQGRQDLLIYEAQVRALPGPLKDTHAPPRPANLVKHIDALDVQIADLAGKYDALAREIKSAARGLNVGEVFISEYHDPTHISWTEFGDTMLRDAVPLGAARVDRFEAQWIFENFIQPLNRQIANAAGRNGWRLVDGIADAFRDHGYSAAEPWVNTITYSNNNQGEKGGTMHANGPGQAVTAAFLYSELAPTGQFPVGHLPASPAIATAYGELAVRNFYAARGVLTVEFTKPVDPLSILGKYGSAVLVKDKAGLEITGGSVRRVPGSNTAFEITYNSARGPGYRLELSGIRDWFGQELPKFVREDFAGPVVADAVVRARDTIRISLSEAIKPGTFSLAAIELRTTGNQIVAASQLRLVAVAGSTSEFDLVVSGGVPRGGFDITAFSKTTVDVFDNRMSAVFRKSVRDSDSPAVVGVARAGIAASGPASSTGTWHERLLVGFSEAVDLAWAIRQPGHVVVNGPTGPARLVTAIQRNDLTGGAPGDVRYAPAGSVWELHFEVKAKGAYSVQIGPDFTDLYGNPLDQDKDTRHYRAFTDPVARDREYRDDTYLSDVFQVSGTVPWVGPLPPGVKNGDWRAFDRDLVRLLTTLGKVQPGGRRVFEIRELPPDVQTRTALEGPLVKAGPVLSGDTALSGKVVANVTRDEVFAQLGTANRTPWERPFA